MEDKKISLDFIYKTIVLLILLAIAVMTFRNTNQVEEMNMVSQDDSASILLQKQQQMYIDSLINSKTYKIVEQKQINNYYENKTQQEISIIIDFTINEHYTFFSEWYRSKKAEDNN